jgi:hypothetical protein
LSDVVENSTNASKPAKAEYKYTFVFCNKCFHIVGIC